MYCVKRELKKSGKQTREVMRTEEITELVGRSP